MSGSSLSRRSLLGGSIAALFSAGATTPADAFFGSRQNEDTRLTSGDRADLRIGRGGQAAARSAPMPDDRTSNPAVWQRHGVARPAEVPFSGMNASAGSIVIDHRNQYLYYVTGPGTARRYTVVVGRGSMPIRGAKHVVFDKTHNPYWLSPSGNQAKNALANPGPTNPLGVRGLYLQDAGSGTDHGYMIHGTNQPQILALADGKRMASHGCIRLHNDDIIDLYNRVGTGALVQVAFGNELSHLLGQGKPAAAPTRQP